jgi:hypothetical protein
MTVRHEIVESPSETGARSREAGSHPAWEFRKGCAPFVGILQGGWPPCKSGRGRFQSRAGRKGGILEQDVNRPSGEPARLGAVKHAAKCVAAANPRLQ